MIDWNIFLIGSALILVGWIAWLIWMHDTTYQKRKNDDFDLTEKPKRNRTIEPEREMFEHTQEVHWPTTLWKPVDWNKSELTELEDEDTREIKK